VGGAERAERRRRQQAAQTATSTPMQPSGADGGRSRVVVAAVAVVALLALVVGGGIWLQQRDDPGDLPAAIPVVQPAADYPVQVRGNVIVAGEPDAPVTIDVYEDFLCPICGDFEDEYGDRLELAAANGEATIRYHPIAILDESSEPTGYSRRAGATAFCAADEGIYPVVHGSLYATQPEEGEAGWTRDQLVQLGRSLGAGPDFGACLQGDGTVQVLSATQQARMDVPGPRGLATPTVLVDGEAADIGDPDWLDEALGTSPG